MSDDEHPEPPVADEAELGATTEDDEEAVAEFSLLTPQQRARQERAAARRFAAIGDEDAADGFLRSGRRVA